MAENQIDKMRISHEMILNWLMLNPEKTQGECAREFGVTEPWLSVIVNSDVFKARWIERRHMMDSRAVSLAEAKMRGVVDKGLERLDKLVEVSADPEFVLNTTDKLLGRLGYGPKTGAGLQVNVQQNNFSVPREVLEAARGMIDAEPIRQLPQREQVTSEASHHTLSSPSALEPEASHHTHSPEPSAEVLDAAPAKGSDA